MIHIEIVQNDLRFFEEAVVRISLLKWAAERDILLHSPPTKPKTLFEIWKILDKREYSCDIQLCDLTCVHKNLLYSLPKGRNCFDVPTSANFDIIKNSQSCYICFYVLFFKENISCSSFSYFANSDSCQFFGHYEALVASERTLSGNIVFFYSTV